MLLKDSPEKFRQIFLLAFTKELIKAAHPEGVLELEIKQEAEEERLQEKVKDVVKEADRPATPMRQLGELVRPRFKPLPKPFAARPPRKLLIPKPRLPPHLRYLKPAPRPLELDLGPKLNPMIADPVVKVIECNGPNQPITIKTPAERPTQVTLTKEEIDNIIKIFADRSQIPATEGVYRVAVGQWLLSAIISEIVGSKFILKKIVAPPAAYMPGTAPR